MSINTFDFAWLIGLLEGEGCFTLNGSAYNKQPMILLQMTDEDVVKRAAKILGGAGFVTGKPRVGNTYGTKIIYRYGISSSLAICWMKILLPHMSKRRQARIDEIIKFWDSTPHRRIDKNTEYPVIENIAS